MNDTLHLSFDDDDTLLESILSPIERKVLSRQHDVEDYGPDASESPTDDIDDVARMKKFYGGHSHDMDVQVNQLQTQKHARIDIVKSPTGMNGSPRPTPEIHSGRRMISVYKNNHEYYDSI